MRRVMDLISIDPARGADTLVWLAETREALEGSGDYWVTRRRTTPSRAARDASLAETLWSASARLTGIDADVILREAQGVAAPAPRPGR